MNELQIFNNPEFGEIRIIEMDGEPWFVGKDVAEILGYANSSKALSDHVDAEDKLNNESLSSLNLNLGQRGGWIINESGFIHWYCPANFRMRRSLSIGLRMR